MQFWCWPCGSLKWRSDTFGWLPRPGPAKFGSSNASGVFPVSIWLRLWSQLAKIDVEGLFHCQRSRVSPDASICFLKSSWQTSYLFYFQLATKRDTFIIFTFRKIIFTLRKYFRIFATFFLLFKEYLNFFSTVFIS